MIRRADPPALHDRPARPAWLEAIAGERAEFAPVPADRSRSVRELARSLARGVGLRRRSRGWRPRHRASARAFRSALFALVALIASACRMSTDYFVHDTEGREYRVACRNHRCERVVESPSPVQTHAACGAGTQAKFVLAGRQVLVACPACVGAGEPAIDVERCRAIRCANDPECPPYVNGLTPHCVHGLCEFASQTSVDLPAAMGLCMAGAGTAGQENAREAADRAAIARASCPDAAHCASASVCRQP